MKQDNLRNSVSLAIASLFTLAAGHSLTSPAVAAPPNEVYSFDVISDTVTGPICSTFPDLCVDRSPYHLATLTVTHEAFAPDHEASLAGDRNAPLGANSNGVVSIVFIPSDAQLNFFNWPSTVFPPNAPPFILAPWVPNIEAQLSGNDITGSIQAMPIAHDAPRIAMFSGIDDHWIGQYGNSAQPAPNHSFVATVTRVPPGIANR